MSGRVVSGSIPYALGTLAAAVERYDQLSVSSLRPEIEAGLGAPFFSPTHLEWACVSSPVTL